MQRAIEVQSGNVSYTLRTSQRARRLRLSVYRDGRVVVTRPWGISEFVAEQYVTQNTTWIVKKLRAMKSISPRTIIPQVSLREYRDQALEFVHARIAHWNQFYHFNFSSVRIRNQKTRWGSCSSKGGLSFNVKILFLPQAFADYIIVHELCHLQEMNHSKTFWQLVARTTPNHSKIRKILRQRFSQ